jgi:radical SAM protein with 4Fe4S-binding SPASM domain
VDADPQKYVRLADQVSLCCLETPCLYHRHKDELYELNQEGLEALLRCHGNLRLEEVGLTADFQELCLEEGLLELYSDPRPRPLRLAASPQPSLRYLEVQITWRCNLSCGHCYLGKARSQDLALESFAGLVREFEDMGGLRLMISGGEPLLHPQWPRINAVLAAVKVRRVLLSNGLLLSREQLADLNVEEVQISLDGLQSGHEKLRGKGTFAPALQAARLVAEQGLDLSIATMVHQGNLTQFEELAELVQGLDAQEWGIDAPCITGRLSHNQQLAVDPDQAARAMSFSFGGAYHGGSQGMACGLHLGTVAPDGRVAQCGFYFDQPLGRIEAGLWTCWARRQPLSLAAIPECSKCPAAEDCGGGCRFRAPGPNQPDPVMCAFYKN